MAKMKTQAELPADSKLITVRMSIAAAEQLAAACQWASYRVAADLDDKDLSIAKRGRSGVAYEWLDWGARWLLNEEARGEVES